MKFCQKCGNQLNDDAVFCDKCGARAASVLAPTPKNNDQNKCPYCGEILSSNVDRCPTCGNEIRNREVTSSVKSFFEKIESTEDEIKKIELIKVFPIPSNKEDVVEFMLLASSAFDAKHYVSNKGKETIDSAWLAKMDHCYKKAKMMFTNKADLFEIEQIYNDVQQKIKAVNKKRMICLLVGIVLILIGAGGTIGATFIPKAEDGSSVGGYVILAFSLFVLAGILTLVFGLKKSKTAKELEQEKIEQKEKEERERQEKLEKERREKEEND